MAASIPTAAGRAVSSAAHDIRRSDRGWTAATAGLLLAYLCLGLTIVGQYGITYDEYWHSTQGENVLA